ncbi:MAG: TRAP transporter substrate-binding protein DctP [Magnetococcales bacterium]|nr:TRAP transporter substrate-binding protein DctP [Magnetococcales bacterium]
MSERTVQRILVVFLVVVLGLLGMRLGKSMFMPLPSTSGPERPPEITWRLGVSGALGPVSRLAMERLAERVAVMSQGQFRLTLHPASELGGDERMLELASRGELPLLVVPHGVLGGRIEAMRVFDLPFLFPSREVVNRVLDGDPGRILLDKSRELGLEGLALLDGGCRHFLADRPLLKPEAFAALQVVEQIDNPVRQELFTHLKSVPVAGVSAPRSGLESGIQALEETLPGLAALPDSAGLNHLTLSGHGHAVDLLAVSRDALDMLTSGQQRILLDAAREATWWGRSELRAREGQILQALRNRGVSVHELSPEGRERFRGLFAYAPRKFEERIGPDVIARMAEWLLLRGPESEGERREILVGLDAQLSGESAGIGLELSRGALLAIEEINARGGILDRKLRLVARDNHGLATRGLDNLKFFASLDDLVAVVGGQKSAVVAAEVEEVHGLELPLLLPWSAARHLTENGFVTNQVFRMSLNDRWAAPFLADAALARGSRIALVLENSLWGHEFEKFVGRHLITRGLQPVAVHWVDNGQGGFASILTALTAVGAEVVMLVDTADESVGFLLELSRRLPALPVVSHWAMLGARLTLAQQQVIGNLDLVFPQTFFPGLPGNKAGEALQKASRRMLSLEEWDPAVPMGSGFVHAYDLVRMLAGAMVAAGSTERRAVRDALETLPLHEGVIRRHEPPFERLRHDALGIGDYRLGRLTPDGRIVPAEQEK